MVLSIVNLNFYRGFEMSITLGDMIIVIDKSEEYEIEREGNERFRELLIQFYRNAEESEEWAERQAEQARDRQRKIEAKWHKRFGCECGLHGITCTHEKQGE
jgi:hypothetical protein